MKFMNGIAGFIGALHDPPKLKILVETLGFGHLHLEVTPPRVVIFRDAIIDLFAVELGDKFTAGAQEGWMALLNYIGGAIIYVKANYAERINVLLTSWKFATKQDVSDLVSNPSEGSGGSGKKHDSPRGTLADAGAPKKKAFLSNWFGQKAHHGHEGGHKEGNGTNHEEEKMVEQRLATNVPTTFDEMFRFNAAVMGFGNSEWMQQVLDCFDNLVTSVANSVRFLEECEILSLRIARQMKGSTNNVRLSEFKACMLASLRSLLPKDWSGLHEVAWTWLWDNTERSLEALMHNPPKYEKSLSRYFDGMDDKDQYELRKEIYAAFFLAAPAGQDYFKQSNTRLHFIAEKILQMTMELIRDPKKVVDDISALGLRHVGYGIPTELFGPFVTACIEVISANNKGDDVVVEAFRWSLGLIAKTLVRTITEGSTIVMKAVNANNHKLMKKAISGAPRGQRAAWMLTVTVGTQAISPLIWAIDTGSLDACRQIIKDLLTMRADRERYYYAMEDIFRHIPDIVEKLTSDAPSLLPVFLEGLVWRSRHTKHGMRRVNYYVKYLLVDHDGGVAGGLRALAASQDPKIMSDPVVVTVSDTMWKGLVSTEFIKRKVNFMISLLVFMVSQAILPNLETSSSDFRKYMNYVLLAGRVINYTFGMFSLGVRHGRLVYSEYRERHTFRFMRIPIPKYLNDKFQAASFVLMWLLVAMCAQEPMIYCIGYKEWPTEDCPQSEDVEGRYQVLSMCAMVAHWLLLVDMAVFSTGLSAFRLVCGHVLSEVSRFLIALGFLLFTFASSLSALRHDHPQFRDVSNTALTLFAITLTRYEGDYREINDEPVLLTGVFIFVMASSVMLLNLLIAQINCSYEIVYQDMIGYARLNRAECIVETLESVKPQRWARFVDTVGLDTLLEFNEGDIGFAGGIATSELANLHPTVEDRIHRYGGSCSPSMKWPEEAVDDDEDQYERLERLIHKAQKKVIAAKKHGAANMGTSGYTTTENDTNMFATDLMGSSVPASGLEEEGDEFFED
jgi:hemoglobin-like flavoprotein